MAKTTDFFFRIGLIVKGVDSVFEVIGGVILLMPMKLAKYILILATHELYRHHQVLAGKLDNLAVDVSVKASVGAAIYLMVHGLAKVILITAIVREKRWGYIGLIAVLTLFTGLEVARGIMAKEIVTGVLGLFDLSVVVLIYKEYRTRFGYSHRSVQE